MRLIHAFILAHILLPVHLHTNVQIDIFKPQYTHIAQLKSFPATSFVYQAQLATIVVTPPTTPPTTSAGVVSVSDPNEEAVITAESNGDVSDKNSGGCIGLMQDCTGNLVIACPDWATDAACQLNYFTNVMLSDPKYGSWAAVEAHELTYNWW